MKIRLYLTVEYCKKRKGLNCLVETGGNIRKDLSSALKSAFPGCELPESGSLSFTIDGEKIILQSSGQLTVNGVSANSRRLKSGDRIIFGEIRIFYNSFRLSEAGPAVAGKAAAGGLFQEIYTGINNLAASSEVCWFCKEWIVRSGFIPVTTKSSLRKRGSRSKRRGIKPSPRIKKIASDCTGQLLWIRRLISGLKTHPLRAAGIFGTVIAACIIAGCLALPNRGGPAVPAQEMSESATARPVTLPPLDRRDSISSKPISKPQTPEEQAMLVIPPGGIVPDFDLDVLFIHTHPDDESLDFGCLMALCEASGLRTGLVTITDGESGLDLYPNRPVTGIYPDHYMEGGELAAVRARELERAAKTLGADLLIRLGRENHPYNSINDELPPKEIIKIWGGKEELIGELKQIILRTRPETVVAPEGPGKAREHFEHEAAGLIAAETMADFKPDDYKAPKRFLTGIDPRQHHLYPEASLIDAGYRVKSGAEQTRTLRDIQLEALLNHRTQNDAVNVGTGFLPKYPAEYYRIQYWRSNRSWEDLLESGLY